MPPNVEEAEIAALYQRHGHALFRRCRSLVGNEAEAHELLQETFCQFWRGRNKFEGRSSVFTFLYRIATNLSIDRLRRRRTAGTQFSIDDQRHAAPTGNPGVSMEVLGELAALTEGLDEETLTVAVLAHVDGLTQDEIADATGVSRRTVGKRLSKFLAHTRKRALAMGHAPQWHKSEQERG